jgi:hypothetical protein
MPDSNIRHIMIELNPVNINIIPEQAFFSCGKNRKV